MKTILKTILKIISFTAMLLVFPLFMLCVAIVRVAQEQERYMG